MRVIIISILCLAASLTSGCDLVTSQPSERKGKDSIKDAREQPIPESAEVSKAYGTPVHLANLEDRAIDESSGIVASRRNPDLFWTHNDSGSGPFLYAFDREGRERGTWRVTGAKANDWEDIASGPGAEKGQTYLYVGDIGDNSRERQEIVVYRIAEPAVTATVDNWSDAQPTEPAEAIRLRYADGKHDAEALAVHPVTGDLYVITKTMNATSAAGVYKLAAPFSTSTVNTLDKVGEIRLPSIFPGMMTGADISPDGRKVILCDYLNAYEMSLPEGSGGFDEVWKQTPVIVKLGGRRQGEAVCYRLDGRAILATSEERPTPLIEVESSKR
jgi:hypothetical protein